VLAQQQVHDLGILQPVPELGLRLVGLPLSFDGARPPITGRAPRLGEHNDNYR
jgi:hypothetical protein